jgi:hypothetical protein
MKLGLHRSVRLHNQVEDLLKRFPQAYFLDSLEQYQRKEPELQTSSWRRDLVLQNNRTVVSG